MNDIFFSVEQVETKVEMEVEYKKSELGMNIENNSQTVIGTNHSKLSNLSYGSTGHEKTFDNIYAKEANVSKIHSVTVNKTPLPIENKSVNVDLTPLASLDELDGNTKYILNIIKESQDVSLTEEEINQIFN